jgi:hypothetical protein
VLRIFGRRILIRGGGAGMVRGDGNANMNSINSIMNQ